MSNYYGHFLQRHGNYQNVMEAEQSEKIFNNEFVIVDSGDPATGGAAAYYKPYGGNIKRLANADEIREIVDAIDNIEEELEDLDTEVAGKMDLAPNGYPANTAERGQMFYKDDCLGVKTSAAGSQSPPTYKEAYTKEASDARYIRSGQMETYLKYVIPQPTETPSENHLTELENNSYSIIVADQWDDAPESSDKAMIFTIRSQSSPYYGSQLWIPIITSNFSGRPIYMRRCVSSQGVLTWGEWRTFTDRTLSSLGVPADAKVVGDALALKANAADIPNDHFKTTGKYYAFGDSLVKAQIGKWTGSTQYSTKGFVNTTAAVLRMPFDNQAVGGQGLIKDWATILDTIDELDMSDASLITVAWSGNDVDVWRHKCFMGTYTDTTDYVDIDGTQVQLDFTSTESLKQLVVYGSSSSAVQGVESVRTTYIGMYYSIMRFLQTKCPTAQIVWVSGYGSAGGNRSQQIVAQLTEQFTHTITFGSDITPQGSAPDTHTTKERYDELEKMANLHGWPCVNQAKGCCFNAFNANYVFGDNVHPTDAGYAMYGNNLANRIAAFYANREL